MSLCSCCLWYMYVCVWLYGAYIWLLFLKLLFEIEKNKTKQKVYSVFTKP